MAKELSKKLLEMSIEASVKWPDAADEMKRLTKCFQMLTTNPKDDGGYDIDGALAELIALYGTTVSSKRKADSHDSTESPSKQKKSETYVCEENEGIGAALLEIGKFYFKQKELMKGGVYSKAAKAVRECTYVITSGKQVSKAKDTKLAGVGKGVGDLIDEFLTTGKMAKLETLRVENM